ncbi:hypothetical protein D3C83_38220 [compost metagenome]
MSFAAACAPVPLIGQSSNCTLCRASRRWIFSLSSSVIVLASMTTVPWRAPDAIPSLPKYAASIAAGEGSDVIITFTRRATSAAEPAASPPARRNARTAFAEGS